MKTKLLKIIITFAMIVCILGSCEFNTETQIDYTDDTFNNNDNAGTYITNGEINSSEKPINSHNFMRDNEPDFEYTRRSGGISYAANYFDMPAGEDYGDYTEYDVGKARTYAFTPNGDIVSAVWHYSENEKELYDKISATRQNSITYTLTEEQYRNYKATADEKLGGEELYLRDDIYYSFNISRQEAALFDTDMYRFDMLNLETTTEVGLEDFPSFVPSIGMSIHAIAQMPDGGYVAIVEESTKLDEYELLHKGSFACLRLVCWDSSGKRIFTEPVYQYSEYIDGGNDQALYTSKDGTIYIVLPDQFIAISPDGEYMYTFVYPEEIASMNNASHYVVIQYNTDGDLVFCYPEQINDMTGGFRYRCFYIDDEVEGLGREYKFPDIGSFCPYFGEGYDVFLHGFNGFYGYNEGDKYPTLLFTYLDIDIDYMMLLDFKIISTDRFAVLINNPIEGTFKYGVVEAVPEETVAKREILTLAYENVIDGESNTGTLLRNIRNFNITNSEYRIEVVEYNSDESVSANDKLLRDIISGRQIDIVVFANSITPEPFVNQSAFLDLYEFMDSDDSYTRDKFVPCVLEPIETDNGKLPYLAVDFALSTLVGSRSILEDYSDSDNCSVWSFDDIRELANSLSGGEKLMKLADNGGDDRLALLKSLLPNTLSSFIDYDGRSCDFGDDFKSLVEVCAFPVLRESYAINPARYIDEVMLKPSVYTNLRDFMDDRYLDFKPDDIAYIGYPTNDTTATEGTLIMPVTGIALTKNCAAPDGGWEFIKSYIASTTAYVEAFTDTPMSVYTFSYFGCAWETVDALIDLVRDAEMFVTTVVSTDNTGSEYARRNYEPWFRFDPNDRSFDGKRAEKLKRDGVQAYVFGDEDEAVLRRLMSDIKLAVVGDLSVEAIVVEEISVYFSGVGSLDDITKQTGGRVKTYLAE